MRSPNPRIRPLRVFLPALLLFTHACGVQTRDREVDMAPENFSYLALGDSYTIGESVDSALRWPVLLAEALRGEGVGVQEPVIVARTGWTTDELMEGIQEAGLTGSYDLVSLLIGVNNQYRGRDLDEYRAQFVTLLAQATAFAGGDPKKVFVLSIPDWGVTPFAQGRDRDGISREIDAFNQVNRNETEAAGVRYLDVTGISREAVDDPGLVAGDGLHPSGSMYRRWAEAGVPIVLDILGSPQR